MTIHFNTGWDGGPWSDQSASLGSLKTGPLGLLTVLESRCGTSGPHLSHAVRVAGMMAALSAHHIPDEWFRSSFVSDPWATSAELLSYRDELLTARIAGGRVEGSAYDHALPRTRLQTLTALLVNPNVPGDGLPDRILDTVQELRSEEFGNRKPLAGLRIIVAEPESLLPPVWRTVSDAVVTAGGVVEYHTDTAPDTDAPPPGLTVVYAVDEWQAAEHLAFVLSRKEDSEPSADGRFALVVSGDAGALDWTLEQWGLPVTGRSGDSAARWGLQILPALLATLWSPADPQAIASFLSLASGLIPSVVSRELIRALGEHPGTGGKKWAEALEKIAGATDTETADFYDRIFSKDLSSTDVGVPVPVLEERLAWLHRRLVVQIDQRQTVRLTLGHITELRDIMRRLGSDAGHTIPRTLLDRIVATVVHPVPAGRPEETAAWTVHGSIASVPVSAGTVFYWNCTDAETAVAQRFTDAERDILAEAGYRLEPPDAIRSRTEWNRNRALLVPGRRIIALVPTQLRGEDAELAPWAAELKFTLGDTVQTIDLSAGESEVEMGGVTVSRHEPVQVTVGEPTSVHRVPPGTVGYPDTLSYSATHSLIGCPMQWTLGRIRRLSAASNVALPTGNQMMGTLAHKIIERIAVDHAPEGVLPENSGEIAATLFDALVPEMAAELLQPGRGLALRRYREIVVSAVTALREVICRLKLSVRQAEKFLEAPWELSVEAGGTKVPVLFRGLADMELTDEAGNPFVLDLKYSHAEKYYTNLISGGEALQLASYAWLIERHSGRRAIGSGYFLLPKQKLVTDSSRAGDDVVVSERTLSDVWRRGERSVSQALRRLHADGIVDVTGLQESEADDATDLRRETMEESGGLYVEPPCKFCDFAIICGFGRG